MKLKLRVIRTILVCSSLIGFISDCGEEEPCPQKSGYVLCGYCAEDVSVSNNPNAGKCIYCPTGSTCSTSDACDVNLKCLTGGGGGGDGGGGGCIPTGCPDSAPWYGCGSCWPDEQSCHTRGTSNLSDDCSVCRKCP